MRDEFAKTVKDVLARRVSNRCSNPACRRPTSGPHSNPARAINIGVAAHISAASADGPRFDANQTSSERGCPSNGIWLCQTCSVLIDKDEVKFSVDLLRSWKINAEKESEQCLSSPAGLTQHDSDTYPENELARLKDIFVPPTGWAEFTEILAKPTRLLVLAGPGGIGKTTAALSLLSAIRELRARSDQCIFIPQPTLENLKRLSLFRDEFILLDAPFGLRDTYDPYDPHFAVHFEQVLAVAQNNWIVVTTREAPLDRAIQLVERRDFGRYVATMSTSSYGDDARRRIWHNHVQDAVKKGLLTESVAQYISDADKMRWILRNLTFPHNISRFVRDEAQSIRDQETLKAAIDRSRDTKEAAKHYVAHLSGAERQFALILTLFSDQFEEQAFSEILDVYFGRNGFSLQKANVPLLRRSLRYVRKWGRVAFEHQDYYDGAVEAIRELTYDHEVKALSSFLADLASKDDWYVQRALWFPLKELARVDPRAACPIVLRLLRSTNPRVVEGAYIPFRSLVRHNFEDVRTFLEDLVQVDRSQYGNPQYKWILFRKALRELVLDRYIMEGDIDGLMELARTFNRDLKVQIFIVARLIDVHKTNRSFAVECFMKWWKYDRIKSMVALQDAAMYRSSTEPRRAFIADAFASLPREFAFMAIEDWSNSESKGDRAKEALVRSLGGILSRIEVTHAEGVVALVPRWEQTGNEIQRRTAALFKGQRL